jgi:2-keto-4-pentenoate hydratase/2-oxohepta-3-ene-1,7-dioic acid hydratase in catechol pathway
VKISRYQTHSGDVWAADTEEGLRQIVWRDGRPNATARAVPPVTLLAPVQPPMILAIGLNYRQHADEQNVPYPKFPVVFHKGINSLSNPESPIVLPRKGRSDKVDYECELAFVISRDAKNVSAEDALDYILGFTCANDVSARDWQKDWGGSQWCRGKGFDSFCPVGPVLVTADELTNYNSLKISTRVNGETLQESTTADLIFDVPTLVEFLSSSTTLPAGTLVLTGTPSGVGMARTPPRWLQPGDVVEVEIESIGVLRNPVVEEVL